MLGLDVGDRRIGVALSDSLGIMASALTVIESKEENADLNEIIALAEEYEVERIIVGMPFSLNGSLGPQAQKVERFTETLSQHTDIPVVTWDERFSSVDAERVLKEAGTKRDRRKKHLDSVAAALVLQSYLDRERIKAAGLD